MNKVIKSQPRARVIKNPSRQEKIDRLITQTEQNDQSINRLEKAIEKLEPPTKRQQAAPAHRYMACRDHGIRHTLLREWLWRAARKKETVVVLDFNGDLVREALRLPMNDLDLIYLSPEFASHGYYPQINPCEHQNHVNYGEEYEEKEQAISSIACAYIDMLQSLLDIHSHEFWTLGLHCFKFLLYESGFCFHDFLHLLQPKSLINQFLIHGTQTHDLFTINLFFKDKFFEPAMVKLKERVSKYFTEAFKNPHLRRILLGRGSTIDLETEFASNRTILVNLNPRILGKKGAKVLGSLILHRLLSHRLDFDLPTSLIVNEAHYLGEADIKRLLGIHPTRIQCTLANHSPAQFNSPEAFRIISSQCEEQWYHAPSDQSKKVWDFNVKSGHNEDFQLRQIQMQHLIKRLPQLLNNKQLKQRLAEQIISYYYHSKNTFKSRKS